MSAISAYPRQEQQSHTGNSKPDTILTAAQTAEEAYLALPYKERLLKDIEAELRRMQNPEYRMDVINAHNERILEGKSGGNDTTSQGSQHQGYTGKISGQQEQSSNGWVRG